MSKLAGPSEGGYNITIEGSDMGLHPRIFFVSLGLDADAVGTVQRGGEVENMEEFRISTEESLALAQSRASELWNYIPECASGSPQLGGPSVARDDAGFDSSPRLTYPLVAGDSQDFDVRVPSRNVHWVSHAQIIVTVPPMQGSPKVPVIVSGCRVS